ncbi:MAG: 4-deoxy-4-formamido-L-arabinose-phosphoundecaprenol deformylase [Deltaproteobacteria bacterium HGW-Deltaproteobacteria-2]|nr:MAG: 4-deoxy-4-formamido-L-arabinose-phosphoundecaprenol deformylase [Deltaproteobacteria bacterium HGW-Deltaproteobacteria-2]
MEIFTLLLISSPQGRKIWGEILLPILGLKIDVDTYWGMKNGVPSLLQTLKQFNLKGTFFLSIGPDNSGRAVLQLIKNPLFLKKMMRTNAPALYGWKTALYGTLLPAPMIALSFPQIVKEIIAAGHEIQFHAWDHRRWQDDLSRKSEKWIREWFAKGMSGFEKLTGKKPTAFGAPSWTINDRVLAIIKEYKFEYLSCTRAKTPFIHAIANLPEIPSDLPCFEEIDAQKGISIIAGLLKDGGTHVLPVHAEVEGGIFENHFRELLEKALSQNIEIVPLKTIKDKIDIKNLPVRKYKMELLPGRHSPCAV